MDFLVIGKIGAPWALQGELKVQSYSGESAHFLALNGATIDLVREGQARRVKVRSARVVEPNLVLAFSGYESPEKARELSGFEIRVPRDAAAELGSDEYYIADLVGCVAFLPGGERCGIVEAMWDQGAYPMLEIRLDSDGRLCNVPFNSVFVGDVDVVAKRLCLVEDWILE